MIKRTLSFLLVSAIMISCGNAGKKDVSSKSESSEKGEKVEFALLAANPDQYVGKNIIIEGKVVHVCTETGKKMFIVGENPDVRLFVAAGENISKFPMELLGSEIVVEGRITKTGGTAIAEKEQGMKEMEGRHSSEGEAKAMTSDSCETETALANQPSLANIVIK